MESTKNAENVKILVMGNTYAGKSSLINKMVLEKKKKQQTKYEFETKCEQAKIGDVNGKCTQKMQEFRILEENSFSLDAIDTRGLELSSCNKSSLSDVDFSSIDIVWWCVDSSVDRIESGVLDLLSTIPCPVFLVLTKADQASSHKLAQLKKLIRSQMIKTNPLFFQKMVFSVSSLKDSWPSRIPHYCSKYSLFEKNFLSDPSCSADLCFKEVEKGIESHKNVVFLPDSSKIHCLECCKFENACTNQRCRNSNVVISSSGENFSCLSCGSKWEGRLEFSELKDLIVTSLMIATVNKESLKSCKDNSASKWDAFTQDISKPKKVEEVELPLIDLDVKDILNDQSKLILFAQTWKKFLLEQGKESLGSLKIEELKTKENNILPAISAMNATNSILKPEFIGTKILVSDDLTKGTVMQVKDIPDFNAKNLNCKNKHGFIFEGLNHFIDLGDSGVNKDPVKLIGGNNSLNGPDRFVKSVFIQDKCIKPGGDLIGCIVSDGKMRYVNKDGSLMFIEVCKGQKEQLVLKMMDWIKSEKITDPRLTKLDKAGISALIIESPLSYEHVQRIKEQGAFSFVISETVNLTTFFTCALGIGISASVVFMASILQGKSFLQALLETSTFCGIQVATTLCVTLPIQFLSTFSRIKPSVLIHLLEGSMFVNFINGCERLVGFLPSSASHLVDITQRIAGFANYAGIAITLVSTGFFLSNEVGKFAFGEQSLNQLMINVFSQAVGVFVGGACGIVGTYLGGKTGAIVGVLTSGVGITPLITTPIGATVGGAFLGTTGGIVSQILARKIASEMLTDDNSLLKKFSLVVDEVAQQLGNDYMFFVEEEKKEVEKKVMEWLKTKVKIGDIGERYWSYGKKDWNNKNEVKVYIEELIEPFFLEIAKKRSHKDGIKILEAMLQMMKNLMFEKQQNERVNALNSVLIS